MNHELRILAGLVASILFWGCGSLQEDIEKVQAENTMEAYQEFMQKYSNDPGARAKALEFLYLPSVIKQLVLTDPDSNIRKAAFGRITEQATYAHVVLAGMDQRLIDSAWVLLTDENILKVLADTVTAAAVRLKAVSKILDEEFLFEVSRKDISDAVRIQAVQTIASEVLLEQIGTQAYHHNLRMAALEKVKSEKGKRSISQADNKINAAIMAIRNEKDPKKRLQVALAGECDKLRYAAVTAIYNSSDLTEIALHCDDRLISQEAFRRITEEECFQRLENEAVEPSIRMAASVKTGTISLGEIFEQATRKGNTPKELGDALAVASLLPDLTDMISVITQACISLIGLGDEARIPELTDLLNKYGDVSLAEDYLNCGQPDLYEAGVDWAHDHGYSIGSGHGSHRARWGSRK